jgi:hypothetical protein
MAHRSLAHDGFSASDITGLTNLISSGSFTRGSPRNGWKYLFTTENQQ